MGIGKNQRLHRHMIKKTLPNFKLQKIIAERTGLSRRAAEKLISAGKVELNNQPAKIGERANPETDRIRVEGKLIASAGKKEYLIVYKPRGYITSRQSENGLPTIMSLLSEEQQKLFPVGRLDVESEGLVLMTNDGQVAYVLTHPKFKIEKTYQVFPDRKLTSEAFGHIKRGSKVNGKILIPKNLSRIEDEGIELTIHSGQKHVVRKIMARAGYEVERLVRIRMGELEIGEMKEGDVRELTKQEKKYLESLT